MIASTWGAQPDKADYKQLANLGIKMVIDLTDDPKGVREDQC